MLLEVLILCFQIFYFFDIKTFCVYCFLHSLLFLLLCSRFRNSFLGIFLHKFFYSPCRIYDLLFSSKEWMTMRTEVDRDFCYSRPRFGFVATGTGDNTRYILWMDFLFHNNLLIMLHSSNQETLCLFWYVSSFR